MLEHIADFTAWPIGIIGSYAGTFISHLLNIELLGKDNEFAAYGNHFQYRFKCI